MVCHFFSRITAKRSLSFCFTVLFCLSLLIFISTTRADDIEIESVIPAYSATCVVIKDISKILDEVKASTSWQNFLSYIKAQGKSESSLKQVREFLGIDLWNLLGAVCNRVALVQIDAQTSGLPTIIAELKIPQEVIDVVQKVEQLLGDIEGYALQPNAGTYLDVPFGLAKPDTRYAFLDNLFVLAPEQNSFESVVNVYRGKEPSLTQDPKFNMMIDKMSFDGETFAYINLEILNPIMENSKQIQALGVYEIKSLLWTISLFAPSKDQEIYIYAPSSSGLLVSLFTSSDSLVSPHVIPALNADVFFAMHLGDPIMMWEKIVNDMKTIMDERDYTQMQNAISGFESETGLNIRNDILVSLTGEIGFALSLPEAIASPAFPFGKGFIAFCGVKDSRRCAMFLERILSNEKLQQTEYKGVKIQYVAGPEGPIGYIFAGDMLVYGNLERLQDIINEEPPLMLSEKFAQINSRLPHPYSRLFYIDLSRLLLNIAPLIRTDDAIMRLQALGSIGGVVSYDGLGLKVQLTGTQGKSWLETIGDLIYLLVRYR